jgi:hypothetical protein
MGRWAEKYTQPQREAVGAAMLDPNPVTGKMLTAKQAVKLLNEGRLGVPAPAEPMPYTTAYDCRNRERSRRAGHQLSPAAKQALESPADAATALLQRAVSVHEQLLSKLEGQVAKDKADLRLYNAVIRNQVQIGALLKPKAQPAPRRTPNGGQEKAPERHEQEPQFVGELLAAHKRTAPSLSTRS